MSEGLVPVVTRPPVARTGSAAMALPAVIVDAGPVAVERFLEFFAASIANGRTRAAYGRAVGRFLSWCAARGLGLGAIAPLHVAAYTRTHPGSAPTVKQHLAAIRVLCDWLVVHQVLPVNPAAAVRGPKHVVTKGATPVLTPAETRSLLDGIDAGSLVGLRDRALLSVMVYSFARVSAVVGMRRQDYFLQGTRGWLRLHEKGGKRHDVPAHHRAEAADDRAAVHGCSRGCWRREPGLRALRTGRAGVRADEPGRVDHRRDAGRELEDQPHGGALLRRCDCRAWSRRPLPVGCPFYLNHRLRRRNPVTHHHRTPAPAPAAYLCGIQRFRSTASDPARRGSRRRFQARHRAGRVRGTPP